MVMPGMDTRPAEQVVLVIPPGTAERVVLGEQPPSNPQDMQLCGWGIRWWSRMKILVEHGLGRWNSAGSSASMPLNTSEKFAFQCSFVPTKIFGIDVNRDYWGTRLWGIFIWRSSCDYPCCPL